MSLEAGFIKRELQFPRRHSYDATNEFDDQSAFDDPFDFAAIPIHPRSKSF